MGLLQRAIETYDANTALIGVKTFLILSRKKDNVN